MNRFFLALSIFFGDCLSVLWQACDTLSRKYSYGRISTFYFFVQRIGFIALEKAKEEITILRDRANDPISDDLEKLYRQQSSHISSSQGYVIYCDRYNRRSAGAYCLHKLCNDLNMRAIPSYVCGEPFPPERTLIAPIIDTRAAKSLVRKGFVVVYPEIVPGNPLGAEKVVRWCLNRPGVLGGDKKFDKREKVFTYADTFKRSIPSPTVGKLFTPTIDESLFFDNGIPASQRHITCYYTGKTGFKPGYIDETKSFRITRTYPDRDELGKLFRLCSTLYSFDCTTILVQEALLCGCRVVLIPDGSQTPEEIKNSEFGDAGISWWGEPLSPTGASSTTEARYETIKKTYQEQLDAFIATTHPRRQNWNP